LCFVAPFSSRFHFFCAYTRFLAGHRRPRRRTPLRPNRRRSDRFPLIGSLFCSGCSYICLFLFFLWMSPGIFLAPNQPSDDRMCLIHLPLSLSGNSAQWLSALSPRFPMFSPHLTPPCPCVFVFFEPYLVFFARVLFAACDPDPFSVLFTCFFLVLWPPES